MKPVPCSESWSRVRELLSAGDMHGATEAATVAVKALPMRNNVKKHRVRVVGHPGIVEGWCLFLPHDRHPLAVLSHDVFDLHCTSRQMIQFCEQAARSDRLQFVRYDLSSWQLWDDLEMAQAGFDPSFWWPSKRPLDL